MVHVEIRALSPLLQASCHFNKVSGEVYHMYLRKDGTAYFSMLSPKERGVSSHSSYLGSYRENKDTKVIFFLMLGLRRKLYKSTPEMRLPL